MKTKIINYFIGLLLAIYYCVYLQNTYLQLVVNKNDWHLGEWLINYQDGGFKRRGLLGSAFVFINELTGVHLANVVFVFLFIIYTLFFILLIKFLWQNKNTLLMISLLLLPTGLGMVLKDYTIIPKKEIIFFLFYLMYLLCLRSKMVIKDYVITLFILMALLIHEAAFFYLPFVSLAYFVKTNEPTVHKIKKIFFYQLLPATLAMFLLYQFGLNIKTDNTVLFLKDHGYLLKELKIYDYYESDFNVSEIYKTHLYGYVTYSISILLSTVTLFIYCRMNKIKISPVFLIIQIIFLIPLFVKGFDWGRWINIFFSLLTLFMIGEKQLVSNWKKDLIAVLLIIFNSFWKMMAFYQGFSSFTLLDVMIKKVYYFLYFNLFRG
ncbi:hypothetical protein [Chryseobacterium herbae]|uniref:EpsG family protein n=1 Tax=Chryseobacterium herbae TaxID=2976476 RepID=A0ABT2IWR1_9FLAO|nr:hypothetical protein [Chryseobacterium sp. pc1-10]MCT2563142.1 hypothetical protein [Chryseobacterium sp. pc1-10]